MVVSVLRRHGESNASVAEPGLRAIANLAADAENRTKLGACDACAGEWLWWFRIVCELVVLYILYTKHMRFSLQFPYLCPTQGHTYI